MQYPKKIELNDDKLKDMLEKKSILIKQGRAITDKLEEIEKEMKEIDEKMMEEEKKVDISDIDADAQSLTDRFNALKEEMDAVNKRVRDRMMESMPKDLIDRYHSLKKQQDSLEEDRNKIAIKAQKYNDKIIPNVRELLKPHIKDEFDDYGRIDIEDGKLVGEIINHLEEYKENFRKKKA